MDETTREHADPDGDDHTTTWYIEAVRWALTMVILLLLIGRAIIRRWVRFA